jgi:hypothetical protein
MVKNIFDEPNIWAADNVFAVTFPVSNRSDWRALVAGADMEIRNDGAASAFYRLGTTAAVEASTADEELAPGALRLLKIAEIGTNTHIACVTRDGATVVTLRGLAPSNEKN